MRYNAFISYRHAELDMEVAKKLHKGLETFAIPEAVRKKYGKKRIERVFRDQEELPIGSDLDDNITEALKESEYLIVVCSPRTPESEWVGREIDSFISFHDRDHVLAVLIEGEPEESFPKQLILDEEGNDVEPLAADVRGADRKERNKKFKTELVRLAAPLIGCDYDELRQRRRERMIRRYVTAGASVALAAAVLGISFGIYNARVAQRMMDLANEKATLAATSAQLALEKTQLATDVYDQYLDTLKNQSRFYAEKSLSLLNEGKRKTAALIAMAALPTEKDERPYVPEAEYALSQALHVYDDGSQLDFDLLLHHEQIVDTMQFSGSGEYFLSLDRGENVYVWEPESWERIVMIPFRINSDLGMDDVVGMEADDEHVYVVTEETLGIYDHEAKLLVSVPADLYYIGAFFDVTEGVAFLVETDYVRCVELSSGEVIYEVETDSDNSFLSKGAVLGGGRCAVCRWADEDENSIVCIIDAREGSKKEIPSSCPTILRIAPSKDGHFALIGCNSDYYMGGVGVQKMVLEWIDPDEGVMWTEKPKITVNDSLGFMALLKIQEYTDQETEKKQIVLALEKGVYVWDTEGKEISRIVLPEVAVSLLLSQTSSRGMVAYSNGVIDWIETESGSLWDQYRIESGLPLRGLCSYDQQRLIRSDKRTDIYLLSYHKGIGLEELPELAETQISAGVEPEGRYYVTKSLHDRLKLCFYDPDGKLLYVFDQSEKYSNGLTFLDGLTILATTEGLWYIDPLKQSAELKNIDAFGSDKIYTRCCFSVNGKYCCMWNGYWLAAIDAENKKLLYEEVSEIPVGNVVMTNDGSKLLISLENTPLITMDLASG
ncbi:MAG: toll/interleukin-1 receptor domain-containing protein [Lachnospiraceae bacterium]|nr:toll/interleukin-1 receptor domain-containing protein [Lachnospiraceae bacterium]